MWWFIWVIIVSSCRVRFCYQFRYIFSFSLENQILSFRTLFISFRWRLLVYDRVVFLHSYILQRFSCISWWFLEDLLSLDQSFCSVRCSVSTWLEKQITRSLILFYFLFRSLSILSSFIATVSISSCDWIFYFSCSFSYPLHWCLPSYLNPQC